MRAFFGSCLVLATASLPFAAHAQDGSAFRPRIHGEVPIEIQSDWTYAADGDNER